MSKGSDMNWLDLPYEILHLSFDEIWDFVECKQMKLHARTIWHLEHCSDCKTVAEKIVFFKTVFGKLEVINDGRIVLNPDYEMRKKGFVRDGIEINPFKK